MQNLETMVELTKGDYLTVRYLRQLASCLLNSLGKNNSWLKWSQSRVRSRRRATGLLRPSDTL